MNDLNRNLNIFKPAFKMMVGAFDATKLKSILQMWAHTFWTNVTRSTNKYQLKCKFFKKYCSFTRFSFSPSRASSFLILCLNMSSGAYDEVFSMLPNIEFICCGCNQTKPNQRWSIQFANIQHTSTHIHRGTHGQTHNTAQIHAATLAWSLQTIQ